MDTPNFIPTFQQISDPILDEKGIKLYVLRTDLNHPEISGNKLYKLKYNLEEAKKQGKNTLLTFGGAFSNHIAATAAAGKLAGLSTIGIIRGDELSDLNPTLKLANENGMHLHYVSRELYRDKEALMNYVHSEFGENIYAIPEGGSNALGVKGCREITQSIDIRFDFICAPCGTGATFSGILLSLKDKQQAIGFQVLKAENYIKKEVEHWLAEFKQNDKGSWSINEDYHFGGYAKVNESLKNFIQDFNSKHHIPLDFVYTGKMLFGIIDLIHNNYFTAGSTIIAVHTGGLQGNKGFTN
jgi:1-aminocyclopropane-1-carboxylate deaminase/D-cysteine desulfhydrase-like pyridoxal-dependent ACC family enzyme